MADPSPVVNTLQLASGFSFSDEWITVYEVYSSAPKLQGRDAHVVVRGLVDEKNRSLGF